MDDDHGNGRVTLAVVKKEIEHLTSGVKELTDEVRKTNQAYDGRLRDLETSCAATDVCIKDIRADVTALEKKSDFWNLVNSLGATIAGIIGVAK